MANILDSLQRSLTPLVTAAGFEPSDRASWKDLAWLEYRRQDAEGVILLGVVWLPTEGKVTAEVWRPDRLAEWLRRDSPDGATEWQQMWTYGPGADAQAWSREVAAAILARLGASAPRAV